MARATKGDGSIRSKGKGVWEVRVAFGKDSVTGKYRSVSRTVHGTKADARKVRDELRKQHDSGLSYDGSRMTFEEFAVGVWLARREKSCAETGKPAKTTVSDNRSILESLCKHIGDARLTSLDHYAIDKLFDKLNEGRDKPLTGSRLKKYYVVLSGVFKLAALKIGDGEWQPKIKLSNSKEKVTLPGEKKAYRLYHKGTKNAFADVIALADESLPEEFVGINMDPMMTETEANLKDFDAVLLTQVVVGPKAKSIETDTFKIQKHMYEKLAELPEETQRLLNPDRYPVYLTPALADLQAKMIKDHKLK